MQALPWKVGQLARRTGVSVRTLHHYEELDLLPPSERSESGHRLYGAAQIERLQQILSLRQLGFSLREIRNLLRDSSFSIRAAIELQIQRLREQIRLQEALCNQLESIVEGLGKSEPISVELLVRTIEGMKKMEKYYTKQQLKQLEQRRAELGKERIEEAQTEWKKLLSKAREAVDSGMDPDSPEARSIALQWKGLIEQFTGGDAGIAASLSKMYQSEPGIASHHGYTPDPRLQEFVARALGSQSCSALPDQGLQP